MGVPACLGIWVNLVHVKDFLFTYFISFLYVVVLYFIFGDTLDGKTDVS